MRNKNLAWIPNWQGLVTWVHLNFPKAPPREDWKLRCPRSSSFWVPRNLSHHMIRQAHTCDIVFVKSREMTQVGGSVGPTCPTMPAWNIDGNYIFRFALTFSNKTWMQEWYKSLTITSPPPPPDQWKRWFWLGLWRDLTKVISILYKSIPMSRPRIKPRPPRW
jgi:hypothetical protein